MTAQACRRCEKSSPKPSIAPANVLANLHLPHLPTHNEVLSRATAMFARTPSIDDIVDQAHALILDATGARLCPAVA